MLLCDTGVLLAAGKALTHYGGSVAETPAFQHCCDELLIR